jgi:hypothetical protein
MFSVQEVQDIFCDAMVVDGNSRLMFASVYGRDTGVQQLFAAFGLSVQSGGLDRLTIQHGVSEVVGLAVDPNRFEKFTGRLPRENLFGNLSHSWIFDPALINVDKVNRSAWVLCQGQDTDPTLITARIWDRIKQLSQVALLDAWSSVLLSRWHESGIGETGQLRSIGAIQAFHVSLPEDYLEQVSSLLKEGVLVVN